MITTEKVARVHAICDALTALFFSRHVLCAILLDQDDATLRLLERLLAQATGKHQSLE